MFVSETPFLTLKKAWLSSLLSVFLKRTRLNVSERRSIADAAFTKYQDQLLADRTLHRMSDAYTLRHQGLIYTFYFAPDFCSSSYTMLVFHTPGLRAQLHAGLAFLPKPLLIQSVFITDKSHFPSQDLILHAFNWAHICL